MGQVNHYRRDCIGLFHYSGFTTTKDDKSNATFLA
jgi:hypothetical protein